MNKVPLTVAGAEKLRQELHRLKTVDRPEVIAAIAEARSHGDLSENAEYDAAKERQNGILHNTHSTATITAKATTMAAHIRRRA